MSWTRIAPIRGAGLEESWVFRPDCAPMAALKRRDDAWEASLLCPTGISCVLLYYNGDLTLVEAKRQSEDELKHMGWSW